MKETLSNLLVTHPLCFLHCTASVIIIRSFLPWLVWTASVCSSFSPSICQSVYQSTCLSIHLGVFLNICPLVCWASVCMSAFLNAYVFILLFYLYLSLHLPFLTLSLHPLRLRRSRYEAFWIWREKKNAASVASHWESESCCRHVDHRIKRQASHSTTLHFIWSDVIWSDLMLLTLKSKWEESPDSV